MPNQTQNLARYDDSRVQRVVETEVHDTSQRELTLRSVNGAHPAELSPPNSTASDAKPKPIAAPSDSPTFAATAPLGDEAMPFQLSLRADQMARLWLREPTLNPNNVFAWSAEKGQWIPALKVPQVAMQITKTRIENVRRWSLPRESRKSGSIAPPTPRPQLSEDSAISLDEQSMVFEPQCSLRPPSVAMSAVRQVPHHPLHRFGSMVGRLLARIRKSTADIAQRLGLWSRRLVHRMKHNALSLRTLIGACSGLHVDRDSSSSANEGGRSPARFGE